jgi:hypothetical protein
VTAKSVKVRVRDGAILYDEEGRSLGVGEELTVTAEDAKALQEAGTAEPVRETAEVGPDGSGGQA